jgi:hypothetical protein
MTRLGALAQLGERRLCKPEVTGSIPVRSIFPTNPASLRECHDDSREISC